MDPTTSALFSNIIIDGFSLESCLEIRATITGTAGAIVNSDVDNKLSYSPSEALFLVATATKTKSNIGAQCTKSFGTR